MIKENLKINSELKLVLRSIRAEKNLSIKQMAAMLDCSVDTYGTYDRGVRNPKPIFIHNFKKTFGIDLSDLSNLNKINYKTFSDINKIEKQLLEKNNDIATPINFAKNGDTNMILGQILSIATSNNHMLMEAEARDTGQSIEAVRLKAESVKLDTFEKFATFLKSLS
jgi:transcriptional regulator with XRE-family HTH domain